MNHATDATDMGLTSRRTPSWGDCPLTPRVRQLEQDVAVMQSDIESLEEDVEPLPGLAVAVGQLNTKIDVTDKLMFATILSVIGSAIAVIWSMWRGP